jgi:hypothetical protein
MYNADGSWREPNNMDRAGFAHRALDEYVRHTRADPSDGDVEEKATDLIGDLMHLLALTGHDPYDVIERAKDHFYAEINGDLVGNPMRLLTEDPDLAARAKAGEPLDRDDYKRINELLYGA